MTKEEEKIYDIKVKFFNDMVYTLERLYDLNLIYYWSEYHRMCDALPKTDSNIKKTRGS